MTDNVNHPAHYAEGWSNGAEVIDITENLSFNLGNVVKYVARAGRKTADPIEDLQKAVWYLSRELERLNQKPAAPWTVKAFPREWDLLDHVPPGVVVEDADGDWWKRVGGTGLFKIAYKGDKYGEPEWEDAELSGPQAIDPLLCKPFREVTP